jgi:hypothetical protein
VSDDFAAEAVVPLLIQSWKVRKVVLTGKSVVKLPLVLAPELRFAIVQSMVEAFGCAINVIS